MSESIENEQSSLEQPVPELPNFEEATTDTGREAADDVRADAVLSHEETHAFFEHSITEHRNNLVSLTLILFAPAALFFTLWFPWAGGSADSFGEAAPMKATIIGMAVAFVFIVCGLALHFAPKKRPDILSSVEAGHIAPSEESTDAGVEHRQSARGKNLGLSILGAIFVLAAIVFAGLIATVLGTVHLIFLYLALTFTCVALAFACFYGPFTSRRMVRHVAA